MQLFGMAIAMTTLGVMASCAHKQDAASETPAAGAGATDGKAQAARGGPLYGQYCAKCHGDGGQGTSEGPPVVGTAALPLDPPGTAKFRKTQFRTAGDVYDFVRTHMPAKAPGSLKQDEYLAIMAFALQANGVDLTGKTVTPEALAAIVLHP
jgi:cytochrome c